MNRSVPFFPKEQILLKPKEQQLIQVEAPFVYEISGIAIIKVLDKSTQNTIMLILKFTRNLAILDITNSCIETVIFNPKEMIGILDLRSVGYYKIKQGILRQDLSKYYRFESADILCKQFNRYINSLKKERGEEMQENIHG